jgi:hypothetical protein
MGSTTDIRRVQGIIGKMIDKGANENQVKIILADEGFTYEEYLRKSQRFAKAGGKVVEAGFGRLLAQGLSLGFADEIEAFVGSLGGKDYAQTVQAIRNGIADYREDNAVAAFSAEMAGAAIPTLAALVAAPFTSGASTTAVAPTLARLALHGAKVGGGTGFVSGVGTSEGGLKNRLTGGAIGTAIGGPLGAVIPGATQAVKGLGSLVKPFVSKTRQGEVVGDILNAKATNVHNAVQNLKAAGELIPGSAPTTAQVARDPGLAALQTPIRSSFDPLNRIGERLSQQNTARQRVLERLSGGADETITRAEQKRARITSPMRESAFDESKIPDRIIPSGYTLTVKKTIDDLLAAPEGKRKTIKTALNKVWKEIKKADTVRELYAIRKDVRLRSLGKLDKDTGTDKFAKSQLNKVIDEIDNVIESAAPGYRAYMRRFSRMSRPIEQMKVLQNIRSKSELAAPDVMSGEGVLSQAALKRQLKRPDLIDKTGRPVLSPSQIHQVNRVLEDLNRATAPTAPFVKVPGSDTAKNLTVANVIGRALNNPDGSLGRALADQIGLLYTMPEKRVRALLIDAMLDPKLAADLMEKASKSSVNRVSKALRSKIRLTGIAGTTGTMSGLLANQ